MNDKGYTLMEVIVSIMILTIASITLAGSFTTIIHFMTKSNDAKNASNAIYAYIEGTDDDKVKTNIENEESPKTVTYSINGIETVGTYNNYKYKDIDDVNLKYVKTKKVKKLSSTEMYKTLMSTANNINESRKNYETQLTNYGNNANDVVVKPLYSDNGKNSFPILDNRLLPSKISGDVYLKIFYPWEYKKDGDHHHGDPVIYVTKNNKINSDEEYIQIIYDYINDQWYYHDNSGVLIKTQTNEIILSWNEDVNNIKYNICKNGNCSFYKNMNDIHSELTDPINGWKVLNGDIVYDDENPPSSDTLWK